MFSSCYDKSLSYIFSNETLSYFNSVEYCVSINASVAEMSDSLIVFLGEDDVDIPFMKDSNNNIVWVNKNSKDQREGDVCYSLFMGNNSMVMNDCTQKFNPICQKSCFTESISNELQVYNSRKQQITMFPTFSETLSPSKLPTVSPTNTIEDENFGQLSEFNCLETNPTKESAVYYDPRTSLPIVKDFNFAKDLCSNFSALLFEPQSSFELYSITESLLLNGISESSESVWIGVRIWYNQYFSYLSGRHSHFIPGFNGVFPWAENQPFDDVHTSESKCVVSGNGIRQSLEWESVDCMDKNVVLCYRECSTFAENKVDFVSFVFAVGSIIIICCFLLWSFYKSKYKN